MRNLFLLFVCIILVFTLKEVKKKETIERLDIVKQQTLDFNGTLFLPQTLPTADCFVNSSFRGISIAGKNYRYVKCPSGFCLAGTAREIPVSKGDVVKVDAQTKLFFAKEIE